MASSYAKQRKFIAITVGFSVIAVCLFITAFATNNWVQSSPVRHDSFYLSITNSTINTESGTANSYFGLFNGFQSITYKTGPRHFPLKG